MASEWSVPERKHNQHTHTHTHTHKQTATHLQVVVVVDQQVAWYVVAHCTHGKVRNRTWTQREVERGQEVKRETPTNNDTQTHRASTHAMKMRLRG